MRYKMLMIPKSCETVGQGSYWVKGVPSSNDKIDEESQIPVQDDIPTDVMREISDFDGLPRT